MEFYELHYMKFRLNLLFCVLPQIINCKFVQTVFRGNEIWNIGIPDGGEGSVLYCTRAYAWQTSLIIIIFGCL